MKAENESSNLTNFILSIDPTLQKIRTLLYSSNATKFPLQRESLVFNRLVD